MPKKWLLLLLFIIISLSLMTYQSNRKYFLPLESLSNVLNIFHEMKISLKDSFTSPFKGMLLREQENKSLKEELSGLLKEQQKWQETFLENKKLRELLALKEKEQGYVIAARVIARTVEQWSNTFILDKGLSDGIAKDMIAVTDKGLIGKISGVSHSYSHLLLLSDINFSAAARLQTSRAEGIISGTGFRKCRLKYVPYEEEVKKGDIVITSGLDLLFPPGIPIGFVSEVNKKNIGIFQEIEVIPFADNSKIEVVAIIKKG
jgi:rod shape-determining protein MreC